MNYRAGITRTFFLVVGVLFFSAIFRSQVCCATGAKAQLTRDEVIEVAKAAAQVEKFDLAQYDMTGCHYEFTRKDQTWTVFFTQKPPTPLGGHFLVWVDDRTKKATLMHGQ